VTVPVIATFLALQFLFRWLDGILGPWIAELLGRRVPGLGLVATILLILLMGIVAKNILGRRIIAFGDALVDRVPLVRRIYRTTKEIVDAITLPKKQLFREVVMIEYPRPGIHSYGFVTSYTMLHADGCSEKVANVFLPNPPVPTTGLMVAVPLGQLSYLDVSVDEALKLILSGGVVMPDDLRLTRARPRGEPEGD
jgi:uncharacterized membrane protein